MNEIQLLHDIIIKIVQQLIDISYEQQVLLHDNVMLLEIHEVNETRYLLILHIHDETQPQFLRNNVLIIRQTEKLVQILLNIMYITVLEHITGKQ